MATAAELKATSNAQLASNGQIPAVKHRTVNDAIIDEMFLSQSRGNVLSGVQAAAALAAGDEVIVIRGGAAYRLQADEFGFIENLVDLADVNISSPANNQAIVYDSATSRFIAKTLALTQTSQIDLGTNATAWNALGFESSRAQGIYTASNTLTLTNVNNLYSFTLQITNTGETVLTIAGITVDFKDSVLPTGVTFASNALTFPDDSAVVYNIIGVSFDGTTFDCKMELDGSSNPLSIIGGGTGAVNASGARANLGINLNDYQLISEKGANNGYGSLDSGGKVPLTQLPSTLLQYQGVWNASTNTPTLINPDTSKVSYVYNVSVAATRFGIVWSLGDWLIYNVNGDVEKSDNSDDVVSVNSQTGAVVLNTSNISEVTNLYYTEARVSSNTDVLANTAKVSNITQDSIVGITGTIDEFNTSITDAILSGNNTGDQTLPTDFVSAANGGTFNDIVIFKNATIFGNSGSSYDYRFQTIGNNFSLKEIATEILKYTQVGSAGGGYFDFKTGVKFSTLAGGGARMAITDNDGLISAQAIPTDFVSASSGGAFGGSISATNLSGTNTGDQTLPTDFVSASSGGTFGGAIRVTSTSTPLTLDSESEALYKQVFKDDGTVRSYIGASATRLFSVGNSTATEKFAVLTNGDTTISGDLIATNLSGTNTGDQTLPTDFVSASSGGTFGSPITVRSTGTCLTLDNENEALYKQIFKDDGTVRSYIGASATRLFSVGNSSGTEKFAVFTNGDATISGNLIAEQGTFNDFLIFKNATIFANSGLSYDYRFQTIGNNFSLKEIATEIFKYTQSGSAGGGNFDFFTDVDISGALTKGSGTFNIPHPLKSKEKTHRLAHSFVEAPRGDNIYRGVLTLENGFGSINLDEHSRMTEGTFTALNKNIQCFTTNESGWTLVKGNVKGNILTIESKEVCNDTISWLVIGERHDQTFKDSSITDGEGNLIVEPLIKEA